MRSKPKMKFNRKLIGYLLAVGLLATFTMDLAALISVKSGLVQFGPYRIFPNLFGRWVGSFAVGKVFHSTILQTQQIPHEQIIGILCHYLIGITLTTLLVYPHVRIWCRKVAFRSVILYGIATCILPWFIMFPAMGFGVMGLKLDVAGALVSFSLFNHVAFGMGIFIWSNVLRKPLLSADRFAEPRASASQAF
jgi:hypothetical protein